MANGNALKVQLGLETEYGTAIVPTKQIQVASEGFKLNLNKKDEGLLTGGRIGGRVSTMSRKVEGSLSTLARPDDVGLFLACALGKEEAPVKILTTDAWRHTFSIDDELPSLTFVVDKVVKTFEYSGVKINSLSFNSAAEDYLKLDMNLIGREEEEGTLATLLTNSPLKSFRFAGAKLIVGTDEIEATSIKFDYNNNLDANSQTTKTGLYFKEYSPGMREIKVDAEVLYNTDTDEVRNDYFLTDNVVALEISFVSGEEIDGVPYSLTFKMPYCQIEDASPAISGAETIKYNLQMRATEGTLAPLTVELVNGLTTKYI